MSRGKTFFSELSLVLSKCEDLPNFSSDSAFQYCEEDWILSLVKNNKYVSTILLLPSDESKIDQSKIEIRLKTMNSEKGQKYNSLLRCVAILICPFVKYKNSVINFLFSQAINPISVIS